MLELSRVLFIKTFLLFTTPCFVNCIICRKLRFLQIKILFSALVMFIKMLGLSLRFSVYTISDCFLPQDYKDTSLEHLISRHRCIFYFNWESQGYLTLEGSTKPFFKVTDPKAFLTTIYSFSECYLCGGGCQMISSYSRLPDDI